MCNSSVVGISDSGQTLVVVYRNSNCDSPAVWEAALKYSSIDPRQNQPLYLISVFASHKLSQRSGLVWSETRWGCPPEPELYFGDKLYQSVAALKVQVPAKSGNITSYGKSQLFWSQLITWFAITWFASYIKKKSCLSGQSEYLSPRLKIACCSPASYHITTSSPVLNSLPSHTYTLGLSASALHCTYATIRDSLKLDPRTKFSVSSNNRP